MVRVHLLASLVGAVAAAVGSAGSAKDHDAEYVAAFVELAAQAVGTDGPATLALNAKLSGEAAARAAAQGAQIIGEGPVSLLDPRRSDVPRTSLHSTSDRRSMSH